MITNTQYQNWVDGECYLEYVGNLYEYAGAVMNDIILSDVNNGDCVFMSAEKILKNTDYVDFKDVSK